MADDVRCDLCDRDVNLYASYVVRIDVFAEPSVPPLTTEDLAAADFGQAVQDLVAQTEGWTAEDAEDSVHKRFEFRVCPACQKVLLSNPLGKPRVVREGTN